MLEGYGAAANGRADTRGVGTPGRREECIEMAFIRSAQNSDCSFCLRGGWRSPRKILCVD